MIWTSAVAAGRSKRGARGRAGGGLERVLGQPPPASARHLQVRGFAGERTDSKSRLKIYFFFCQTCKNPLENMDNSLTSGNYLEFTAISTLLNERLGEK